MLCRHAFILAGGQSSRFGSDKARARLGESTLIENLAQLVAITGLELTVVADVANKYQDLGLNTVADDSPNFGPLGGLLTALRRLPSSAQALVLSCDLVGVRAEWLTTLTNADPASGLVLFDVEPRQPLLARYAANMLTLVESNAAQGRLALHALVASSDVLYLPRPDGWEQLRNVNRPDDL